MFSLSAVSRRFGAVVALDRLSLVFADNCTSVIIGPSGCGKTTLLRLLVGLDQPDEGRIEYQGQPLAADQLPRLRRRWGYVIQGGGLFPHLSARDNIELMARHIGQPPEQIAARVAALCELVHLPEQSLHRYPGQLSGGQNQRVGLMRALMLEPEVLILDEPLAALDPMIRFELQQELREIFSRLGTSVILVTHDLSEAGYLGDEVILLNRGRIEQRGPLEDLLRNPASDFTERFVRAQRPLPATPGGRA